METTLFGIPVFVSVWTLVLVLLMMFEAVLYINRQMPDESGVSYVAMGIVASVLTVASVALHEISHAVAAELVGVRIVKAGISWWGAFVMPEATFAQIDPLKGFIIAFSGPLANVVIALLCLVPVVVLDESLVENTIQFLSYINIKLARLNLLPVLVLDGGKVVYSLVRLLGGSVGFANWFVIGTTILTLGYYLLVRKKGQEEIEDRLEDL